MPRDRKRPDTRRRELLHAAVRVAERDGYQTVTRAKIAQEADVSEALVSHYFGSGRYVKRLVMAQAICTDNLVVLAQGLAVRDEMALTAPLDMRERAIRTLGDSDA